MSSDLFTSAAERDRNVDISDFGDLVSVLATESGGEMTFQRGRLTVSTEAFFSLRRTFARVSIDAPKKGSFRGS